MKAKAVRFEKLVNLGNFENEKVCFEVEVEEGDVPDAAYHAARVFVYRVLGVPLPPAAQETDGGDLPF